MSDVPSPTCHPPDALARVRRTRLRNAAILGGLAVLLASLGPSWHVPVALVAIGATLLFSFAVAAVSWRGAPGAPGPPWLVLLILAGGIPMVLSWAPWRAAPQRAVLVEIFLAPGPRNVMGLVEDARRAGPARDSVNVVLLEMSYPFARERLGSLVGLGHAMSEGDARALAEPVVFVDGAPRSRLESLAEAVRREAARAADTHVSLPRYADGPRARIPEGMELLAFRLVPAEGGAWRALGVETLEGGRLGAGREGETLLIVESDAGRVVDSVLLR